MNKKHFLFSLAGSSLTALASLAQTPPNIVLINLDDSGYGDFSHRGAIGYQTPHIDRMAANGLSMNNFYAIQPISGASRAGLLTGCYPNRIGFAYALSPNSPYGINEKEETIAELLHDRGYATAIYGKWHLGDEKKFLPLQHGFDEYYGLPYSNDMWPYHPEWEFPDLPLIEGNEIIGYNTDQTRLTTDYTDRATDFIRRNAAQRKPFFLYLAHNMPHVPLAVSDKFKGKSEAGLYGDVMMEIDWSVGEVLSTLREERIEENTLVILTSDNGPWALYGNHAGSSGGLREAKATTFNGGTRVPCIVYWKGQIQPAGVCNQLYSNIDILPTLAEVAGAKMPKLKIDGISMLPALKDPSVAARKFLCFYYHKNSLEAITDGRFKLVYPHKYPTYDGQVPGHDGMPGVLGAGEVKECELYDLRSDMGERTNVIGLYPEIVEKLNKEAEYWREELGDDMTHRQGRARREAGKSESAGGQ